MRLDKFLSWSLGISRAQVGRELRAQRITVDGAVVRDGAVKITPQQQVVYQGQVLPQPGGPRYFMLYKPQGYVCSTDDASNATILYFIDEPMAEKLYAVGRLDKDTTGLVLLTDDGQWSHRVTSPKHHCEKSYLVTLEKPPAEGTAQRFAAGILLRGEAEPTLPATLELMSEPNQVRLTICEGRYHQVKRMFAAEGNHVLALHRERIGGISLDPELQPGEYRPLTPEEVAAVFMPAPVATNDGCSHSEAP
ncbi:MAG: 16S rRNA pseudouridine(516) synthase RsuA [Enterobacteriaceae bacterium]